MIKFLIAALIMLLPLEVLAIETPQYETLGVLGESMEIRQYPQFTIATTLVPRANERSDNPAFRRLAGYIFGDNASEEKISMTAPVLMRSREEGAEEMAFFLPASVKLPPEPVDTRVTIRQEDMMVAVIRYKGSWNKQKYEKHLERLRQALSGQSVWEAIGSPIWARYDPPFKPWFLRTNEIMIPVVRVKQSAM
jgi:hypothetical protein